MSIDPIVLQQVTDTAQNVVNGDICLPWWVVAPIVSGLSAAAAAQWRRANKLQDRQDIRYDDLIDLVLRRGTAGEDSESA